MHKIFGTAGAGKTTFLINELDKLFENGVIPEQIAFVSFTRKAVEELIDRSVKQFTQFKKNQFKYFRTIHSMCFADSTIKDVISFKEIQKLAQTLGLKISSYNAIESDYLEKKGDKVIQTEALARLRMINLEEQCKDNNYYDCPLFIVKDWREKLNAYKKENNVIDFTDMLEQYNSILNVKYIFIDEAQDLCPLQWIVMNKASQYCEQVFIAGDDDQAIFNWAGADIEYFLNIKSDEETILSKTYRMPILIHDFAKTILKRIKIRKEKNSYAIKNDGSIKKYHNFNQVIFDKKENYLILVRNKWQIKKVEKYFIKKGIPYISKNKNSLDISYFRAITVWNKIKENKYIENTKDFVLIKKFSSLFKKYGKKEEIEKEIFSKQWDTVLNLIDIKTLFYFKKIFENGYSQGYIPNIKISTIHQAKGGECDNVILFKDVSTLVYKNINSDFEHKVWYVAVTRAKKNLFIITEQGNKFYNL